MRVGLWVIDLLHCALGCVGVSGTIGANAVRGTFVLRLAQGWHGWRTVGVQVVFEDRSDDWVRGPEKRLWKPPFTRRFGLILRENAPLYGHLTARAISSPPH